MGVGGSLGEFTDRREALAAVEALMAPDSPVRVLVVHGVAGQGKSALLRHLTDSGPDRVLVDLDLAEATTGIC